MSLTLCVVDRVLARMYVCVFGGRVCVGVCMHVYHGCVCTCVYDRML